MLKFLLQDRLRIKKLNFNFLDLLKLLLQDKTLIYKVLVIDEN